MEEKKTNFDYEELKNSPTQQPNNDVASEETVPVADGTEETGDCPVDEYGEPIYTSEWLKENSSIGGWLAFFLFAIAIGGLLSGLYPIVTLNPAEYVYNTFLMASDIIFGLEGMGIAIYTIYAFNTRKPNAVFWGKVYTIMVLVSHLGLMFVEGAVGSDGIFSNHIRGLVWGIIWFLFLMYSARVEEVIPSSFRQVKKYEWGIVSGIIIVPVLCAVIGVATVSQTYNRLLNYEKDGIGILNTSDDEKMSDSPEDARRLVEADVELSRKSCPMQSAEGVMITDITISGNYIVYHCSVDEGLYSISLMKSRKSMVKDNIKESLKEEGEELLDMLKKANMGIQYIYTGKTSHKSVTIAVESEEL